MLFAGENNFNAEIAAAVARWSGYYHVAVPTALVKGIIARESSFRETPASSVEPTGDASHGLMRVREATARALGLTGPIEQLHDAATGISYGVHYLAQQLLRYGGDPLYAAAAYNAGPGNVSKSRAVPNPTYVDKVLGFTRYFQQRVAPIAFPAAAVALALVLGFLVVTRVRRRAA